MIRSSNEPTFCPPSRFICGNGKACLTGFLIIGLLLLLSNVEVVEQSPANKTSIRTRTGDAAAAAAGPTKYSEDSGLHANGMQMEIIPLQNELFELGSVQHLHLDVPYKSSINSTEEFTKLAYRVADIMGLNIHLVSVAAYQRNSEDTTTTTIAFEGMTLTSTLEEGGHFTMHSLCQSQTFLLDVVCFSCRQALQEYVPKISHTLQVESGSSSSDDTITPIFSLVMRGDRNDSSESTNDPGYDESVSLLSRHSAKKKLYQSKKSSKYNIQVWETEEDHDRHLFVDAELLASVSTEAMYYEALVHPAFMGSALPPKRVLILGNGQGATLREVLKYESVEEVVLVYPDREIVQVSKRYLPSLHNCTELRDTTDTTSDCFEDPRVTIHEGSLASYVGGTRLCQKTRQRLHSQASPFDVVIIDAFVLDTISELGEFEDPACFLTKFGTLTVSLGEAPDPSYRLVSPDTSTSTTTRIVQQQEQDEFIDMIEQIQELSTSFWHHRVYEIPLLSQGTLWSFFVGIVPDTSPEGENIIDVDLQKGVFDGSSNGGINHLDGTPAFINLQLRRRLKENVQLKYYDGAVQHSFRYSLAGWENAYCANPKNDQVCQIEKLFSKDYEDEIFELRLEADHNGRSGTYAKTFIPNGTVTGLWDAATTLDIAAFNYYKSRELASGMETQFNDFPAWVYTYGFDGGTSSLGERVMISINSMHNFLNHECSHTPNLQNAKAAFPWLDELVFDIWNPVGSRIETELSTLKIASRDIATGELITDDYSLWDGFLQSSNGLQDYSRLDEWCGVKGT